MNNTMTVQELKTRGASVLNEKTKSSHEAFITVRGQVSFVVMRVEQYHYLRECELEAALNESKADLVAGKVEIMTPKEHIKKLKESLK